MGAIAVTGANGTIGGAVLRQLAQRDSTVDELLALTRRPLVWEQGAASAPENRIARYEDREALNEALLGVETVVMVSSDGESSELLMHHRNIIDAARGAGVERLVLLSSQGASRESPFCYSITNACTEEIAIQSGLSVAIVRASIFADFFMSFVGEALRVGELRIPAGEGRISFVQRSDVAAALGALALEGAVEGEYLITGPEGLGMLEVAERVSASFSTPIEYVDIEPARYRIELVEAGTDPWWAYAYATMFEAVRRQEFAPCTDDLEGLTGVKPSAFI